MRKYFLICSLSLIAILAVIAGVFINKWSVEERNRKDEEQISKYENAIKQQNINKVNLGEMKNETKETSSISDEKTSPGAYIVFEKHYTKCNHTIIEKEEVGKQEVNKDREYFENAYSDWNIKEFSKDEVHLYKSFPENCGKHYLIKENEGRIAIYVLKDDGEEILKEKTDISTQYLPEADLALLKVGITANGDAELSRKLEDFE